MNTIKTLLLLSFSILFFGCNDEEDKESKKEFAFSASELKQTEWKGEIFYLTDGNVDTEGYVNIVFYTESKGVYEYKLDYQINPEKKDFEYEIQDKYMHFSGAILTGRWILQKYDGDSLVIADNKAAFTDSKILKLKRVN